MPIVKFLRESYLTWQIPIKKLIKSKEWSGGIKSININSWSLAVSRKILIFLINISSYSLIFWGQNKMATIL